MESDALKTFTEFGIVGVILLASIFMIWKLVEHIKHSKGRADATIEETIRGILESQRAMQDRYNENQREMQDKYNEMYQMVYRDLKAALDRNTAAIHTLSETCTRNSLIFSQAPPSRSPTRVMEKG